MSVLGAIFEDPSFPSRHEGACSMRLKFSFIFDNCFATCARVLYNIIRLYSCWWREKSDVLYACTSNNDFFKGSLNGWGCKRVMRRGCLIGGVTCACFQTRCLIRLYIYSINIFAINHYITIVQIYHKFQYNFYYWIIIRTNVWITHYPINTL